MAGKLGDWRWYVGSDSDDDEMMDSGTRDQAVADGKRQFHKGESFWIVEARMTMRDERAMERGEIDTAPFAETRNGQWVKA